MAQTLSNVLSGFSINLGVHGELLVFALFTWARDNAIVKQPAPPLSEFCRHFSVEELSHVSSSSELSNQCSKGNCQ